MSISEAKCNNRKWEKPSHSRFSLKHPVAGNMGARVESAPQAPSSRQILAKSSEIKAKYIIF